MKKIFIAIAVATSQLTAVAQTVNVHFKNGQTIEYPSSNVDYINFSTKASDPTVTIGEAVDLGLSVLWASCNLGAKSPEEYGDYYAWGEVKTKEKYTPSTYSYYNNDLGTYISIGDAIEGSEYDAATVNLGNNYRLPTDSEFEELIEKCEWEWTNINGVKGFKISGSNGNSIFMPATGYFNVQAIREGELQYWTSREAKIFYATNTGNRVVFVASKREIGRTIRPVRQKSN